jgi:hypothetical protein
LTYWAGVLADGDSSVPEPSYEVVDADTGQLLVDRDFSTWREMEAFIAQHYPEIVRWVPPPAPPEEIEKLSRVLDLAEGMLSGYTLDQGLGPVRNALIGQLYRWSHSPETVARIYAALNREKP